MSVVRRLSVALLATAALTLGFTPPSLAATPVSTCTQAYTRLTYTYDDPGNVPLGVDYFDAATSDVTSGPDAGQQHCASFQQPLAVRESMLTDSHLTFGVMFDYGSFAGDSTPFGHCEGVVVNDFGGADATAVLQPLHNVADDPTTDYVMFEQHNLDSSFLAGTPQGESDFQVTIFCDNVKISDTTFVVNVVGEPGATDVSLARTATTSKASSERVHGRLMHHRHGLAFKHLLVQEHTASGWHRYVKVRTDRNGRYSFTAPVTSHRLRAHYPWSLRFKGSTSQAR